MTVLPFVWFYGIWLSLPMFCVGIAMLFWCARTFSRVQQVAELARVPLTERQLISFGRPGRVLMRVEGIPMNPRPLQLSYHLIAEDGTFVASRPLMSGFTSTAFLGWLHLQWVYDVPRAGNYTLMIRGLEKTNPIREGCFVVFEWPTVPWVAFSLLGILLAAGMVIGGLALFMMEVAAIK